MIQKDCVKTNNCLQHMYPEQRRHVQSNDVDANNWGVVRYYIVGGNVGNRFKIHSVSGQITVQTENFDFELRASYILTVRVVDTVGDRTVIVGMA